MTARAQQSSTSTESIDRAPRAAVRHVIRPADPAELSRVGQLASEVYAALPGMPRIDEQPAYYAMLRDAARRASNPAISVFVAAGPAGELLGCVDFIAEMAQYGSGGTAGAIPDAAGMRLLAVDPQYRGQGTGKALTQFCIQRARDLEKASVILHTTRAMEHAWAMYERLGFERLVEIDFQQGALEVFGFRLCLADAHGG
jgi:ribosomal protein S18 acetylase RimI-like enzyme